MTITLESLIALRFQAKQLSLKQRNLSFEQQTGPQLGQKLGRGMVFSEVRHYQPGDDIRSMDWKVTARTNKPHTKLYQEEKEQTVLLLIDLGGHMQFATRGALKSVVASQAASLLAWSSAQQGDKVGAFVMAGQQCLEIPPRKNQFAVLQLLHTLASLSENKPSQSQAIDEAMCRVRLAARPGNHIILISDFTQVSDSFTRALSFITPHHQVYALCIRDPLELALPEHEGKALHFCSLYSSDDHFNLQPGATDFCRRYQEKGQAKLEQLSLACRQHGVAWQLVLTNEALLPKLNQLINFPRR